MKSVLIVGGYGQFGSRLSQRLAKLPNCKVFVAGRNIEKATALCQKFGGNLEPVKFDRNGDLAAQLTEINPAILVDATGPFQAIFETGYGLPKQCAKLGVHYIDLSDSGVFTKGISELNNLAKDSNVALVSGASSVPALSGAVANAAKPRFRTIKSIEGGISPGGKINIGLSVTKAVLSYLGKPLKVFRGGEWAEETGFSRQHKKTVIIDGETPIKRQFGLCDAPDLLLFPDLFTDVDTVRFHGSTELAVIHNTLRFLAWVQNRGIIKNLQKHARLFAWGGTQLGRFASERGCMYMELKGEDKTGNPVRQQWNLIASNGDGPYIPILAAEILVKRWLKNAPHHGARSAAGEINLTEFERAFRDLSIVSAFESPISATPLFKSALGENFEDLAPAVHRGHDVTSFKTLRGIVDTKRGSNPVAILVAACFGFPRTRTGTPIEVTMDVQGNKEIWIRKIDKSTFKSVFSDAGKPGHVNEMFGPVKFKIHLVPESGKLHYNIVSARFFGIPIPGLLMPESVTHERQEGDAFHFDVDISLPFIGPLIKYTGSLT